jgi:hypothetical protein
VGAAFQPRLAFSCNAIDREVLEITNKENNFVGLEEISF